MAYKIELNQHTYPDGINPENFNDTALTVFQHQYTHNNIYRRFCDAINRTPTQVKQLSDIPFLPISFFKTHEVVTDTCINPELIFESSGTTGEVSSRHLVQDAGMYERSLLMGFRQFYGEPGQYAIIGLLPSYLERKNASLVYMSKVLMEESRHPDCGFFLNEFDKLSQLLTRLEQQKQKVLLIGVTFALLDFATAYPLSLENTIVMETGGMKGRREEMTRTQVHEYLKQYWKTGAVHSEYGMTELLSQAYSTNNEGVFQPSATMKVLVRDINDPLDVRDAGSGCLNIIDLANLHSCSFIATEDIGNLKKDGSFEVLGRMDHAALRGCSLMAV